MRKGLNRFVIVALVMFVLLLGCGKGGDNAVTEKTKNTLSENEFVSDPSIRMRPHQTVTMYLEPRDAMLVNHSDTGSIGIDVIPITIEQEGSFSYSLDENAAGETIAKAEMLRLPDRTRVFELNSANRSVTITMPAGNYDLILHSGYTAKESGSADHKVVFLQPQSQKDRQQKTQANNMMLSLSCPGCDLVKANLKSANLANTNLSGADLTQADLTGANLDGASFLGANTTGTVWSTGSTGSTVTLVNNCSVEVWAGIAGNTAVKSCKSNSDCGGGVCDLTTAKPTCKEIFCGSNSDCPVNSFCGGVTSYAGSCLGDSTNECGTNRFCDTENKNFFPNPNSCTKQSDCAGFDPKAKCDTDTKRCFIYQCGWKTCNYVPLPVKNMVSPAKTCSDNKDCGSTKSSTLSPFCYVTSSSNGQCALVNTDGNGFQMASSGSTQTFQVPRTWGGRFWPRTECIEQCSKCPDAFCQTNSDCPSNRSCLTDSTASKTTYCNADSQCKSYEKCDMKNNIIESPRCENNNWINQCQSDNDCNSNSSYTNRGFNNMKCLTRTDLGCGGQTKPVNVCVFSQCSSYRCTESNTCNCGFQCSTGGCIGFDGKTFSKNCIVSGKDSPTLAELFMPAYDGNNNDFYDVSMVDGANLSVRIAPDPNSYNLNTLNGIDKTTSCTSDSECWDKKKSPNWVCGVSGEVKGYCVNKFQCSSPGCISNDDCDKYGLSSFLSGASKLKPSPWGGGDLAVAEKDCKDELKLKVNNKYVGCLSPRDACNANTNYLTALKCNQQISSQGTYLNLYSCDGPNSGSCYTDGAQSNCCGCPDWLPKTFCVGSNPTWVAAALPYHRIFHDASPTSYSFPYDDKNSTFTCIGKSKDVNVNYTITFCPK